MIFLSLLLLQAAPAATPTPTPKPAKVASADDKVTCRTEEIIGSRLGGKKVCLTKREWRERAQDNVEELNRAQRGALTAPRPGN